MDLLHHVWKDLLGGESLRFSHKADQIKRVLDVGTGTGGSRIAHWKPALIVQGCGRLIWPTITQVQRSLVSI